ncbi:MAG TPA: hypothetical protein VNI52_11680 [Sphingobacteriaceae bacterium]|nr:hypothetical protein [Sphingobacteriaceae bacterium]
MADIDQLLEIISDPRTLDIQGHWPSFPLDDVRKQKILLPNKPGVYALIDDQGRVLYVGKGNCINSRLKSHKEIGANNKAEAWAQFFSENFKSGLTAYFLIIDKISKPNIENAKKAIERIVQIKYEPLFDRMYNTKGKRAKYDFKGSLKECNYL